MREGKWQHGREVAWRSLWKWDKIQKTDKRGFCLKLLPVWQCQSSWKRRQHTNDWQARALPKKVNFKGDAINPQRRGRNGVRRTHSRIFSSTFHIHHQSVFVKTFWDSFYHLFNFLDLIYFKDSNSLSNTSPWPLERVIGNVSGGRGSRGLPCCGCLLPQLPSLDKRRK